MRHVAIALSLVSLFGCRPRNFESMSELESEDLQSYTVNDKRVLATCKNFVDENGAEYKEGTFEIAYSPKRSRAMINERENRTGVKQNLVYLCLTGKIGLGGIADPTTKSQVFKTYDVSWSLNLPPLVSKVSKVPSNEKSLQFAMYNGLCKDGRCSNIVTFKDEAGASHTEDISNMVVGKETVITASRYEAKPTTYRFTDCNVNQVYAEQLKRAMGDSK